MPTVSKVAIFCGFILLVLLVCPVVTAYDSQAEQYYNDGVTASLLGKYSEAVASFDKAVALKPDYPEAWSSRGAALHQLGRYDDAAASFDKAIAINPSDAKAWNNRGLALFKLGRNSDAVASYDKALMIDPSFATAKNNREIVLAQQTQDSPLLYAPAGALVLVAGLIIWSRRRPL